MAGVGRQNAQRRRKVAAAGPPAALGGGENERHAQRQSGRDHMRIQHGGEVSKNRPMAEQHCAGGPDLAGVAKMARAAPASERSARNSSGPQREPVPQAASVSMQSRAGFNGRCARGAGATSSERSLAVKRQRGWQQLRLYSNVDCDILASRACRQVALEPSRGISTANSRLLCGRVRSGQLDPWQLAHGSNQCRGEFAILPGMPGDDQAVCESERARFK